MMDKHNRTLPLLFCVLMVSPLSFIQTDVSQAASSKTDLHSFKATPQLKGLTLEESARFIGLSYGELSALIKAGHIVPTKSADTWRIKNSELRTWLTFPPIAKRVILRSLYNNREIMSGDWGGSTASSDTKYTSGSTKYPP